MNALQLCRLQFTDFPQTKCDRSFTEIGRFAFLRPPLRTYTMIILGSLESV